MNNNTTETTFSNSKQKRIERDKKREANRKKNFVERIIIIVLGALILCGILFAIGREIYKSVTAINPSDDFGYGLTEEGFISDIKALDYVTIPDYKNMKIALSDVEFTDEEVEAEIQTQLENHKVKSEDVALEAATGDTVNIDYVGTIDGVEFEGGNSNGAGRDLELGSGSFIDDFEDQLVGAHPGDELTVNVTFPEDYQKTELAGKDAEFAVTVNSIYVLPEFNDEFVKENLADYGNTVDEYKKKLKEQKYETNLTAAIEDKMIEESEVTKYPKKYLKHLKSLQKYMDQQNYEYMNQMYMSYYGSGYSSFSEYVGMSDEEYDKSLDETVKENLKQSLVWQAVLESENETVTEQELRDYMTEQTGSDTFDTNVESYGKPYTMAMMVRPKALEILKGYVT
nr:FKBP-type peptidyl-prolyl cis-trans isomerase [Lachnospiraceae bacterium]